MKSFAVAHTKLVDRMVGKVMASFSNAGLGYFLGVTVKEYLQLRARMRFDSEGDETTGPWPDLVPSTVRERISLGYGGHHPINVRTGDLKHAVIGDMGTMIVGAGAGSYTWPSGLPEYVRVKYTAAQLGREGKQTERPVVASGPADLAAIMKLMAQHVNSSIGGRML